MKHILSDGSLESQEEFVELLCEDFESRQQTCFGPETKLSLKPIDDKPKSRLSTGTNRELRLAFLSVLL